MATHVARTTSRRTIAADIIFKDVAQDQAELRYATSEAAWRTVLDRLLALNHERTPRRCGRGCMIRARRRRQGKASAASRRPRAWSRRSYSDR
jgi:hypothetical protein